jgi:multidrug efflux system outer membrane protein
MKRATPFLIVAMLAGCMARPPAFQRPPVNAPDVFRAAPSADGSSLGDQKWWNVFEDESLQALIRKALADNFDVKIAANHILQATEQVTITRADQFPTLNGTASGTTQRSAQSGPFPAFGVTSGQFGVAGSWNLDFWHRYRSATEAARATLLATEWAKQEVAATLVANVANGYFSLRELDLELEIAKQAVARRGESVDLTKTQEEHGLISLIDVRQAEQLVAAAAAQIPDIERRIEQQENALSTLAGANPGPIVRGRKLVDEPHAPEVPVGLPSALLERRPDIRQIEEELIAAGAEITVARAAIYPQISLTGSGGLQSSALTRLFTGSAGFGSFAASLVQPIFEAGRIRANIRLSEERQQELVLTYQKTVQQAFQNVSDALIGYRKNREFREQQETLVTVTRDAVRLSNLRYNAGEANYLEVLTNETNALNADLGLAQARRNELLSLVAIYQALGGGWQN